MEDARSVQLQSCTLISVVGLMSALWVPDHTIREWKLKRPCDIFRDKYDEVQKQIMDISCMDDLLSGKYDPSLLTTIALQLTRH